VIRRDPKYPCKLVDLARLRLNSGQCPHLQVVLNRTLVAAESFLHGSLIKLDNDYICDAVTDQKLIEHLEARTSASRR
jgi:hypothetical protein